jgi:hypothetical protein
MAILQVDAFRGKMTGGGARANLFEVNVNYPGAAGGDTELTNFMCRAAQLPGVTMNPVEVPFRGRLVKFPGDRTFEDWTMTVYNDTNFGVRDAFEAWMNSMNTHLSNVGLNIDNAGYGTYLADIEVNQLNEAGSTVKKYKLRNAFPTIVSPIELSYDQTTAIEEFTVTLTYDYWTNDNTL